MADADIIPLGTRGRPGRGSRAASPSKAARSLAPPARSRTRRPAAAPDDDLPAPPPPRHRGPRLVRPDSDGPSNPATDHPPAYEVRPDDLPPDEVPADVGPAADHQPAGEVPADEVPAADAVTEALTFLRRRVTGDYEVDEFGFDAHLTSTVLMRVLRPLAEKWFRIEVRGLENIPAEGGALLVSNHSGTLPLDALMTGLVVHDHADRYLRALGADLVFTLPFVSELARKGGATLACGDDAERMLAAGELVGVWPEGFKGIGKPYRERYKLQRFGRGGFVSAAIKTGVPIVPCSVVGAEEIYPLMGNIPALAKLLKVPYVPVTPTFPWLGPLGLVPLPSKWVIDFGEPLRTDSYPAGAADDPMLVFNVKDQVRETIQQTLYTLLMHRTSIFY